MASMLAERGVIEDSWLFLAARVFRRGARLQAGEYKFDKPASPLDVYGRIARGDIDVYKRQECRGSNFALEPSGPPWPRGEPNRAARAADRGE